jgi:Carboxypeptidase regulatory-like domain/TonB-dependent Receptor Plug Domain
MSRAGYKSRNLLRRRGMRVQFRLLGRENVREVTFLLIVSLLFVATASAQSGSATINGIVLDPSGAAIAGAQVLIVNDATGVQYAAKTNGEGIYVVPNLPPGPYRIQVSISGFKTIIKPDITLNVQDALAINFTLPIGAASEIVTVQGGAPLVDTQSAAVSTVIDRQFVENLPLNGRSFNTLLQLTPGVLIVSNSNSGDGGQFSVNGQRATANYFEVDGVSVNFGVGSAHTLNQSGSGSIAAFNSYGGTSSLVSVDALQEFRVQTSSFAPEYGRTPGGQVSITTMSGTSQFHGDVFDYFRNTVLDANDWFANAAAKPRAPEQQNDFGGVFGGPILRGRTFFFLSYEGLRLLQPQAQVIEVPSVALRSAAIPAAAAFLDAYPLPDAGAPVSASGNTAQFTGSYSNRITMDAASIRLDHNFNSRMSVFGRFNWAPSQNRSHVFSLSDLQSVSVDTGTVTVGLLNQLSTSAANSFRFNYSSQKSGASYSLDSLGGAIPPAASALIPSPYTAQNSTATFVGLFGVPVFQFGRDAANRVAQWNVLDDLNLTKGSHQFKFGMDYRRLYLKTAGLSFSPSYVVVNPTKFASAGATLLVSNQLIRPAETLFRSFSLYAQDLWSISKRVALTYGLRWELVPPPSGRNGTVIASWQNVGDPANTALAPAGVAPWSTQYGNFAPRVGIAYRPGAQQDIVIRAGFGIFYDLGTGIASALNSAFPNGATGLFFGQSVPVQTSAITPSFSTQPPFPSSALLIGFDPHLRLPYSYQWNVAIEKSLWGQQSFSVTYVGQAGRRLIFTEGEAAPNQNFQGTFLLSRNGDTSNYNALQVQFRRPLSHNVQALLSYVWSHSIDTNSDDSFIGNSTALLPISSNRGNSDFDVRNNFTGAVLWDVPAWKKNSVLKRLTGQWSLDTVFQARGGFPINIFTQSVPIPGLANASRPDLVPNQPIWQYSSAFPGGRRLNSAAFALPATPRQGTLGRNAIIGFGAAQVDASVGRKFSMTESVSLLFRTDIFNLFNHANFSSFGAFGEFPSPGFGVASQMLNHGFAAGGLNSLYQIGGPRSMQLSLKLIF